MPKSNKEKTPCECSTYEVLVGLRESEPGGDLVWDEALNTGCPGTLTGRNFAPGHDAKLKGFLIRWGLAGYEVTKHSGGMAVSASAQQHADKYDFGHMVRAGIALGRDKHAEAKERKAKKAKADDARNDRELAKLPSLADRVAAEEAEHEAKVKAEREAQQAEVECWHDDADEGDTECPTCGEAVSVKPEVAEPNTPNTVSAKIGRWVYEGVEIDGVFHYQDANNNPKSATKYALVD